MRIVVLDGFALNPGDLSWERLSALGELVVYDRTPADKVKERSDGAEILLTNKTPLPAAIISQLPALKYIGVLATGFNIVDIEAAKERKLPVTNIPGYGTASVVQMTFALLFELALRVQRHSDSVMNGNWAKSSDWSYWEYPLVELAGKTIGIIGFGNIGAKVGDVAAALGMNILATSRHRSDQSQRKNFQWASIPELLQNADVVSIHCPLSPETKGLINRNSLQTMKRSAFLVNTSRGPIIVEEDLAEALNNEIIAGAGLDVLGVEPPAADHPLVKAKNCIITPHIAWATKEARSRLMERAVSNLEAFLKGSPVNVVNK